jgi:hypothetical protein
MLCASSTSFNLKRGFSGIYIYDSLYRRPSGVKLVDNNPRAALFIETLMYSLNLLQYHSFKIRSRVFYRKVVCNLTITNIGL